MTCKECPLGTVVASNGSTSERTSRRLIGLPFAAGVELFETRPGWHDRASQSSKFH